VFCSRDVRAALVTWRAPAGARVNGGGISSGSGSAALSTALANCLNPAARRAVNARATAADSLGRFEDLKRQLRGKRVVIRSHPGSEFCIGYMPPRTSGRTLSS
jgi:hypothetical protein